MEYADYHPNREKLSLVHGVIVRLCWICESECVRIDGLSKLSKFQSGPGNGYDVRVSDVVEIVVYYGIRRLSPQIEKS
jgi:hypothetical protein